MGQQQLLVLVLCVVTVGIAAGIGLSLFDSAHRTSARDALVQEGFDLITDLQTWKVTPATYGGGQGTPGFAKASFTAIGKTQAASSYDLHGAFYFYESPTGCYVLATQGTQVPSSGFLLGAYAAGEIESCTPLHVFEGVHFSNATALATVTGLQADDIAWRFPQEAGAVPPPEQ